MPLAQRMVTQPAFTYHRTQGTLAASSGASALVNVWEWYHES